MITIKENKKNKEEGIRIEEIYIKKGDNRYNSRG